VDRRFRGSSVRPPGPHTQGMQGSVAYSATPTYESSSLVPTLVWMTFTDERGGSYFVMRNVASARSSLHWTKNWEGG